METRRSLKPEIKGSNPFLGASSLNAGVAQAVEPTIDNREMRVRVPTLAPQSVMWQRGYALACHARRCEFESRRHRSQGVGQWLIAWPVTRIMGARFPPP